MQILARRHHRFLHHETLHSLSVVSSVVIEHVIVLFRRVAPVENEFSQPPFDQDGCDVSALRTSPCGHETLFGHDECFSIGLDVIDNHCQSARGWHDICLRQSIYINQP